MFDLKEIFTFWKKKFTRQDLLLILFLVAFYFLTRLINLDRFPIFSDEGIYIRWAKVAWQDANWRFISLTDGKQPLQTWGTIPFLKIFPDNALFAGRLFSVVTGFLCLIGVFTLLYYLFNKKTAFIGSFLYIVTPYFLFYDRMALVDSGVNAAFIWILFLSILLVDSLRLDVALIFGLVSGLSLLAKSSVRIFLILSLLAPLSLVNSNKPHWNKKTVFRLLFNYLFLFFIGGSIALVIYNIQRLSPFFHYVAEKNKTFIMTFDEFLKAPFSVFFHNLKNIPLFIFSEMGFITAFVGLAGLIKLYKEKRGLFFYLSFWLFASYFAIAFFNKVLFPRYLIFLGSILLITAAFFLAKLKKRHFIALLTLIVLIASYYHYTMIFDYKNVPFPQVDRGQYIEGWPAGWGIRDIMEYARNESLKKPVLILAEGNFGMTGDVLDVFLKRGDRIIIKGYWPLGEKELEENLKELKNYQVLVVFSHQPKDFSNKYLQLIRLFDKPGNESFIHLFQLTYPSIGL